MPNPHGKIHCPLQGKHLSLCPTTDPVSGFPDPSVHVGRQEGSAPPEKQLSESARLWGGRTDASQTPTNQLSAGKASGERQEGEPGTGRSVSAGSGARAGALRAPCQKIPAGPGSSSALGEEPGVSALASARCKKNPMHQTSKYLW